MNVEELLPPEIFNPEETNLQILASLDFEQAAHFLDLENWIVNRLRHPARELTVHLPLTRDDGSEMIVTGLRVQHGGGGYPKLGPVHLSAEEDLHQLRAAAMGMTWQMALLELPLAGAAGAIGCNPAQLSERELRRVTREYAAALAGMIGPTVDVLAPGIACNPQTMAWMLAGADPNPQVLAAVVGKPAVLWGAERDGEVAAAGLARLLAQGCGKTGMSVALQGLGPATRALAQRLNTSGTKLVGWADSSGALWNEHGLEVEAIDAHVSRHGVLFGYAEAEPVSNADLLACECDVLVLDAAAQQVTLANAERVRARLVVEAVNGAVTRRAEERLAERGIATIPHLLASLCPALAAALEWERSLHPTAASFDGRGVEARVAGVYERTEQFARQHQMDLRQAAMIAAVQRVAAQTRLKGRE